MVFSSEVFLLCFLPLFLVIYHLLPRRHYFKNPFILLSSFIFYAWGEPRFIILLFFTTMIDFFIVRGMGMEKNKTKRKTLLIFSLCINLGLLFYFKYFNFFTDNLNGLLQAFNIGGINAGKILLPIGISFFTFESITYAVDVYRDVHKPLKNFWEYQMYIIFFPKLIAGPIIRYSEIADQIRGHVKDENAYDKLQGFIRFCIGLGKKVFIANTMGRQADMIFGMDQSHLNTPIAWIGILAFTLQIYFDFSGYSDMAIGLARIMGFRIRENFMMPFISQSITEFWRRWHITLGLWMKNYVYIPLGGNRVAIPRLYLNLVIIFIISGLWHGAAWHFIIWGLYNGVFMVTERFLRSRNITGKWVLPNILYAFGVVMIGFVLFRSDTVSSAIFYVKMLFSFHMHYDYVFLINPGFFALLAPAIVFSFCCLHPTINKFQERLFITGLNKTGTIIAVPLAALFYFLSIVYLSGGGYNPFIYFNF